MKKITEIILDKEAPLNLKSLWAEPQKDNTVALKVFNNGKWASTQTKVDLSAYQTKTDESLQTSDKTIAGAINELNSNIDESGYNLIEYGVTPYETLVEMAGNRKPSYLHLMMDDFPFFIPASIMTGPAQIIIFPGICYFAFSSEDSSQVFGVISLPTFTITNENVWPDADAIMGSLAVSNNIDVYSNGDTDFVAPSCETVKNYVTEQLQPYAKTSELTSLRNKLQQTETGVTTANSEIEKLKSGKQDVIIPGTGLAFEGSTLNVTLDTNVFFVAESAPASPTDDQKKKICLVPADTTEEGNFYTEYVWVVNDGHPDGYWEEIGTYKSEVDLTDYLKSADAANTYLSKTDAQSTYLSKTEGASTYLSKTDAAAAYQPKGDYALKNQLPSYTKVPALTADYTIPANATTREFIYEIPVGGTPYNITGAEGIKWASGVAPTTQMNHTYIVSVINNLAVWGEF